MDARPLGAVLVEVVLAILAAVVVRRSKPLAIALGAACFLVAPWYAGSIPLLRGLAALVGGFGLLRILDVARAGEKWSASRRVFHVLSLVDTRLLERDSPRIAFGWLARALAWAAVAATGYFVSRSPVLVVRWLGGVVFAYGAIDAGYASFIAGYRLLGFVAPPLHVWPLASLTVGELWSVRWARPISGWLREHCFRPLARRRHALLGLMLGFVISGVGHAYPVFVASDATMALMMLGFFLVQGLIVVAETKLGVARWPRPARRAWTITMMLATSPLFVEPALRVVAGR